MRDFTKGPGRLRAMPFHARLVYSVFLAFTLLGLGVTVALAHDMVGLDLSRAETYYAGGRMTPELDAPDTGGGPQLDLPDELLAPPIARYSMPRRKLLEVTHFHLFSMPVYLLILSHLYMLSRARPKAKTAWIALGSIGTALHLVAPWISASGMAGATAFYAVSGLLLAVPMLVMCAGPLVEMWLPVPAGAPRESA